MPSTPRCPCAQYARRPETLPAYAVELYGPTHFCHCKAHPAGGQHDFHCFFFRIEITQVHEQRAKRQINQRWNPGPKVSAGREYPDLAANGPVARLENPSSSASVARTPADRSRRNSKRTTAHMNRGFANQAQTPAPVARHPLVSTYQPVRGACSPSCSAGSANAAAQPRQMARVTSLTRRVTGKPAPRHAGRWCQMEHS